MTSKRIDGYLGLARRGGYLVFGETALGALTNRRVKLLLVAGDSGERTKKDVLRALEATPTKHYTYSDKTALAAMFGKTAVAIIGITSDQLAKQIIRELEDSQDGQEKAIPEK